VTGPQDKDSSSEHRWQARPILGRGLSTLIAGAPLVAATVVLWALRSLHPSGHGWAWYALLLGSAVVVSLLVDRCARLFLPLAALLRLTMLFPDRAPSRLKIARRAGSTRDLVERLRDDHNADAGTVAENVLALMSALGSHDKRTRGHSERVRIFCDLLGEELRLPEPARDRLRWAALLHDVGKLSIAPAILNKPAQLDEDEFQTIKRHPASGAELASPLMPWLGEWGKGIVEHHERYDGGGYPAGLGGEDISQAGRIVAIVDAFETMTAARTYKKPMATKAAREELARCAGTHFDAGYVRAFLAISLPRLVYAMGPLSFLAHLPFMQRVAEAGARTAAVGQSAAVVGVAAAIVTGTALAAPAPASLHGPAVRTDVASTSAPSTTPAAPSAGVGARPAVRRPDVPSPAAGSPRPAGA